MSTERRKRTSRQANDSLTDKHHDEKRKPMLKGAQSKTIKTKDAGKKADKRIRIRSQYCRKKNKIKTIQQNFCCYSSVAGLFCALDMKIAKQSPIIFNKMATKVTCILESWTKGHGGLLEVKAGWLTRTSRLFIAHTGTNNQPHSHTIWGSASMFLDCGRKMEDPARTQADTRRTCKLHAKKAQGIKDNQIMFNLTSVANSNHTFSFRLLPRYHLHFPNAGLSI